MVMLGKKEQPADVLFQLVSGCVVIPPVPGVCESDVADGQVLLCLSVCLSVCLSAYHQPGGTPGPMSAKGGLGDVLLDGQIEEAEVLILWMGLRSNLRALAWSLMCLDLRIRQMHDLDRGLSGVQVWSLSCLGWLWWSLSLPSFSCWWWIFCRTLGQATGAAILLRAVCSLEAVRAVL